MQKEKEKMLLDKVPAVICTAGSYISVANSRSGEGGALPADGARLYDHMSPYDALCFEAHFAGGEDSVFSFPISGFHGFACGIACFTTVAARRFAVVYLFRNEKALSLWKKENDLSDAEVFSRAVAPCISSLSCSSDARWEKGALLDMKSATYATVKNIMNLSIFEDFSLFLTENSEMKETSCMPEGIPLSAYVQMLVNMLLVINAASVSRAAEVKLCRYGADAEVRISTDAKISCDSDPVTDKLREEYPSVKDCLGAARYTAGLYKSRLTAFFEGGTLTLVLSLKEGEYEETDFKYRDPLYGFEEAFSFAAEHSLLCMLSDAEQQGED